MGPAERLHAAAEQLKALDTAATPGRWTADVHPDLGGSVEVDLGVGPEPIALSLSEADVHLIAALRPLAPVIAEQLRGAHDRWLKETSEDEPECPWCGEGCPGHGTVLAHSGGCGGDLLWDGEPLAPEHPDVDTCHCFDDALALADAILGGAS